ncbi:MAG: hypothetical protein Q9208_008691 [Pyrenodesmia sp. 3 TL-2023]
MLFISQSVSLPTWSLLLLAAQLIAHVSTNPLPANEVNAVPPGTSTIAATSPDGIPVNSSSFLAATLPPSDFTVEATVGTVELDRRQVFPLTIHALSELVGLPPNDPVRAQDYRLPEIQGMSLATSGVGPQSQFQAQYMIWGLTLAVRFMKDRQEFRNWRFTLQWQGNVVGGLFYLHRSPRDTIDSSATLSVGDAWQTDAPRAAPSTPVDNAVVTFSIYAADRVHIDYDDAMMVLVAGMTDLAGHRMDEPVDRYHFETTWLPYTGWFSLSPSKVTPASLRQGWFVYGLVSQLITRLTSVYSSPESVICQLPYRTVCRAARIRMRTDDVLVGDVVVGAGFLTNRHNPYAGAMDKIGNVTSS